ncbi:hypothetical protein [Ferruginibacter sp.]|nr:hypothetical protein [Ferruginibacter sp.]
MKKSYSTLIQSVLFFKKGFMRFGFVFLMMMFFIAEESVGQTTYTWNQTGVASWAVAANWTPIRTTPATNDILIFNNAATTTVNNIPTETIGQLAVSATTTVKLRPAVAGNTLTIAGLIASDDLTVTTGSALNIDDPANALTIFVGVGATGVISGNMTLEFGADHRLNAADASGIVFNSPAFFIQYCSGNAFTNSGTPNAIVFNTGATFEQHWGLDPFALLEPASKVVFNTGSLFDYSPSFSADPLSFSGRKYADLFISGLIPTITCTGSSAVQIDNLDIGDVSLNFNMTGNPGHSIKGNISVSPLGSLHFAPASAATINFNGTAAQTINNTISPMVTFGNNQEVVFNNPAGITFTGDATFNNLVTFTSGVVTIANPKALTFSATATVAGASNASFVDGKVAKIGNSAFTFPVGKTNCGITGTIKGYAALAISNFMGTTASTDQFTAEYKRGDALPLGNGMITNLGISHVSRCDYWTLTRDGATASTVDIALSWNSTINNCASYPATYINDLTTLTIAHNSNIPATSPWDNFATVGSYTGTALAGQISWTGVQSGTFGAFALASISFLTNPLPSTSIT